MRLTRFIILLSIAVCIFSCNEKKSEKRPLDEGVSITALTLPDTSNCVTLTSGDLMLIFSKEKKNLLVCDTKTNQQLIRIHDLNLIAPVFSTDSSKLQLADILKISANEVIMKYNSTDAIDSFRLVFRVKNDHIQLFSEFTTKKTLELNKLDILSENTDLNMYNLVNFRNSQETAKAWPEMNIGGRIETSTNSTDWQFAPHPTQLIFTKNDLQLFIGALDLPHAFGFYFRASNYKCQSFYLDYGQKPYGQTLKKGEHFKSPVFGLFTNNTNDIYNTIDRYVKILYENKFIPSTDQKKYIDWHIAPLYCTWLDQVSRSEAKISANLQEQTEGAMNAIKVLDQQFIREVLAVIKKENLPFKSILIDDGWQLTRGEWTANPKRFPEMRKLVDEIHAAGLKAIVWWNWAELEDDANVKAKFLIENGKRNKHGARMFDYSNPKTQKEYLAPLFKYLFSSEPGCLNFDGYKNDFQGDKVHADMKIYNTEWRGEENYFFNLYKLCDSLLRKYKPDGCHIGCSAHPYLSQFIDINRTYDVWNSNVQMHLERAKMLKHFSYCSSVAYDMFPYLENIDEYYQTAIDNGFSVQVGNILYIQPDRYSTVPVNSKYYEILRNYLKME